MSSSFLGNGDLVAFDELYQQYSKDKSSVDSSWQRFFEGFEFQHSHFPAMPVDSANSVPDNVIKEFKVINLINS